MTEVGHETHHLDVRLREALLERCQQAGWSPQYLGSAGQAPGLDEALVEIIACRDAEATLLSLELIECCEALGWQSPWLEDNRARLLVHRGEEAEARQIWEELSQHPDPAVVAIAVDTLQFLNQRSAHQVRADRIRHLRARDQHDQWRPLLLEGLLNGEDMPAQPLQVLLEEIAVELEPPPQAPWDSGLLQNELRLQLYEEQMDRLEQC